LRSIPDNVDQHSVHCLLEVAFVSNKGLRVQTANRIIKDTACFLMVTSRLVNKIAAAPHITVNTQNSDTLSTYNTIYDKEICKFQAIYWPFSCAAWAARCCPGRVY
jgi:hypothetical protein